MVGESGTGGSGKKYYYYKCTTAKKKGDCHRKALRKNDVDELAFNKIVNGVFDGNVINELANHVCSWQEKENTTVPLLQIELAEVEKSLENVMSAIEQGIITPTTKKRMSELESLKADIEVKIAREEIQTQILTKEQVEFWLKNMARLNMLSNDNKQRIIDTFVNSIYVYDDKLIINFNCREDSETIPLELTDNCSFLQAVGEPNWTKANHLNCSPLFIFYPGKPVFGIILNRD